MPSYATVCSGSERADSSVVVASGGWDERMDCKTRARERSGVIVDKGEKDGERRKTEDEATMIRRRAGFRGGLNNLKHWK